LEEISTTGTPRAPDMIWGEGKVSRYIAVDPTVCTGCRECEVVCSLYHFGQCNPAKSAIRVARREKDGLVRSFPLVCQQCEDAPCIEACPENALFRDSRWGNVLVDSDKCTGCAACMDACPAGCLFLDPDRNVAICCDLCGGETKCVIFCHSRCLTVADDKDRDRARGLAGILEAARP
jgi:Fe-S-cluster-containing hydrogenase component 2